MTEISCRVERIVFRNENNGFTVAETRVLSESESGSSGADGIVGKNAQNKKNLDAGRTRSRVRAVGIAPTLHAGMRYTLRGEFETNKFGEQFSIGDYEELPTTDAESIEGFLGSGIIKGVGPAIAARIVAKFGDETMRVLEAEPRRLLEISGIGKKNLANITESFAEHREIAEVSLYFAKLGVSRGAAMTLYKLYGAGAPDAVKEDPYRLVREAEGIDFKTADKIAMRLGFAENAAERLKSAAQAVLLRAARDGNTYLPEELLFERTQGLLGEGSASRDDIEDALLALTLEGALMKANTSSGKAWFLGFYFDAEKGIANGLKRLMNAELLPIRSDIEEQIDAMEREKDIELSDEQKNAVRNSLSNAVFVITGGPGTGKTTIIKAVADIFARNEFSLALAAPTGRAAKRISEQTGRDAKTIHRLLEYAPAKNAPPEADRFAFGKNAHNPLEIDALIVDEASMVDAILMSALVDALPSGARLILVGDADQLPPVGPGNVLKDVLFSERIDFAALKEIYRQAAESLIVTNAHRINRGEKPQSNEKDGDFFFYKKNTEESCLETILELCTTRLPKFCGLAKPNEILAGIQVITPIKQGTLGTHNLNARLQAALNPPAPQKREKTFISRTFREGDKVMQMKNDYMLSWIALDTFEHGEGVFNGDIGFVESIDTAAGTVSIVFDGNRLAKYESEELENIELAYAITVHKSQGSEYPAVVMPIMFVPPMLAVRNLLYTAVTRAKDLAVLVGSEERMAAMAANAGSKDRYSALADFLRE